MNKKSKNEIVVVESWLANNPVTGRYYRAGVGFNAFWSQASELSAPEMAVVKATFDNVAAIQVFRTPFRRYWVYEYAPGIWRSMYVNFKPGTNREWQAQREISKGHNAYRLDNYKTKAFRSGAGGLPEDWSNGEWTGACLGFATREEAVQAVRDEIARSGK